MAQINTERSGALTRVSVTCDNPAEAETVRAILTREVQGRYVFVEGTVVSMSGKRSDVERGIARISNLAR